MNDRARSELDPPATILKRGDSGPDVKRLQEWLCLHDFHVAVDGDFGPATEAALMAFQQDMDFSDGGGPDLWSSGAVDEHTWAALAEPMRRVVGWKPSKGLESSHNIVDCARAHLAAQPREVGKPNGGPWVRLYCRGQEVPWCAGFATTALGQALGHDDWYTRSCDELAQMAHARGLLVHQPPKEWRGPEHVKPGDLFLVRNTERWPHDWIHCGIVTAVGPGYFETIEGNTNTDGSREGTEVCKRVRAFKPNVDFVLTGDET